jgi:predicted acyltransferase
VSKVNRLNQISKLSFFSYSLLKIVNSTFHTQGASWGYALSFEIVFWLGVISNIHPSGTG